MIGQTWAQELQWVQRHIPETTLALARFPSNPEARVAVRFHIDLKMIPVIEGLSTKLKLLVFPCHKDTTDSQGWAYLGNLENIEMEADWAPEACLAFLEAVPSDNRFLCDLGGEMIAWAHQQDISVSAALEGTTSGLNLVRKTEREKGCLSFPLLDWNNARLKREIHNEKMVGFSLWQTFSEVTRLSLHGKTVGVLGFGPVGRGIARTARALGARVIAFDPCPRATLVADFEGFWTPGRPTVLKQSQVLVTATGASGVIDLPDLPLLTTGCILLNAGHSEEEWSKSLRAASTVNVLRDVEKWSGSSEHHVYLLAKGRLLNLAAGFGDTINAFDITSAQLVDALRMTVSKGPSLEAGVHALPDDFYAPSV